MRRAALPALLALMPLIVGSACGKPAEPPADASTPAPTPPLADPPGRLDGTMRFNDGWLKVAPFVSHSARLDLKTQCLTKRDDNERSGKPAEALCFDYVKRDRATIAKVRVELGHPSVGDAMKGLRARNESVHFGIEKNGSHYQYLDLVHAARRDGAYQADEIRIIASGPEGRALAEPLLASLRHHFPGLTVAHVEIDKP